MMKINLFKQSDTLVKSLTKEHEKELSLKVALIAIPLLIIIVGLFIPGYLEFCCIPKLFIGYLLLTVWMIVVFSHVLSLIQTKLLKEYDEIKINNSDFVSQKILTTYFKSNFIVLVIVTIVLVIPAIILLAF